jgi:hypothetical protein
MSARPSSNFPKTDGTLRDDADLGIVRMRLDGMIEFVDSPLDQPLSLKQPLKEAPLPIAGFQHFDRSEKRLARGGLQMLISRLCFVSRGEVMFINGQKEVGIGLIFL